MVETQSLTMRIKLNHVVFTDFHGNIFRQELELHKIFLVFQFFELEVEHDKRPSGQIGQQVRYPSSLVEVIVSDLGGVRYQENKQEEIQRDLNAQTDE